MRMRRFSAYFSLAIVTLLTILVFFLSTPLGSKASIYLINTFAPIDIGYRKGVILDDVEFSHIKFEMAGLSLDVRDVHLDFHLRCLWQKRICVDQLSLGSINFDYLSGNDDTEDTNTEDVDVNSVLFPWSIKTQKFTLDKGNFVIDGNEISVNGFSTSFLLTNNQIKVEHLTGQRLGILLVQSTASNASVQPINSNQSAEWPLSKLPEISLPFDLAVSRFSLAEIALIQTQNTTIQTHTLLNTQLDFHWKDTVLKLKKLKTDITEQAFITSTIALSGDIDFKENYPMNMALTNNMQQFPLWVEINQSAQKISASGDLSALTVSVESTGDLALIANANINLTNELLPFSTDINATNMPLPQAVSSIAEPSILNLKASGNLKAQTISLLSKVTGFGYEQANVSLQANIENQKIAIEKFSFKEDKTASDLSFTGFVAIDEELSEKVSWQLALNTTGFSLPNIMLVEPDHKLSGRINGKVYTTGEWQGDSWQIAIKDSQLNGVINEQALTLNGDVSLNSQWHMLPSKFNLTLPNIQLAIEGYTNDQWHVTGHASANNFSKIIKQLNVKTDEFIDGSFATEFSVSGDIKSPLILFNGQLTNVYTSSIVSDSLTLKGQYQPNSNHAFSANINSEIIQWETTNIEQVKFTIEGDLAKQKAAINWLGDTKVDVELDGEWFAEKAYWHGNISKANISYLDNSIAPDGDIFIQVDLPTSNVKVSKHCWLGEETQVCLKQDLQIAESGQADLSFDVGLNFINKLLQQHDVYIDSNVTGDINAQWVAKQTPTITSVLHFSPGSVTLTQADKKPNVLMNWSQGTAKFDYANDKLSTGLTLASTNNTNLIDINVDIALIDNYPISGKAQINQLDLKPLQAFVNDITQMDGSLNGDLTVNGTLYEPVIEGPLDINLANIKLLSTPTVIQSAKLNLHTQGTRAELASEIKINNDLASLTGDIDWQNSLAFDLSLTSEKISFAVPPQISATLKPQLNAKLTDNKLKLSGRVDVLKGMLQIEKLPEGSVALSKDVVIVNDSGIAIVEDKSFEIETDIRLAIANNFKVKGQGFEGQITGDFQISQQKQQPLQLFGTLKVPEGEYKAYGQHLSVDKGVISFNGAADNPYIDLRAVRPIEKEDITVGINVKGQANALELTIFSNPTMEQPEALSYLTRGRGLDAETGGNAAIGMALGKTLTNSSGILNQIERLPLLNKLEVDGDGSEASIAGYIGDRVYLKYAIGITEPINELTVRFYILSRLWAETVTGLEESADLYYSFDIE